MISYWNPTSGNDSNDGLSVANAKLTIGAAETVAGLGGTVVITSGTHSLSGLLTFAGQRTYTSENPKNKTTLQWGDVLNDALAYAVNSANPTIISNIRFLGLRGNTSLAPIYQTNSDTSADLSVINCVFSTYGNYGGGGQFWNLTNSRGLGTFTFKGNQVVSETARGSSTSYLFVFREGTYNIEANSFYVTSTTDTDLAIIFSSNSTGILTFSLNNLFTSFTAATPTISFNGIISNTRSKNVYYGDDALLGLVGGEIRQNWLPIDPVNANLSLLPNSPAITSGGVKNYESTATFATDGVKWLDFTEVGGTGTGLDYANPVRTYTEWQNAYASGDIWVVKGDLSVGKTHDKGAGGWTFPAFPMTVIGEYKYYKAATLKITAGVNQVFNGPTGSELVTKHLTYSGCYGGNPVNGIFYGFDKIKVEACFLDPNPSHSGRVFQACDDVEIVGTQVSDKGVNLSIAQAASTRLKAVGCTFAKLTSAIIESGTVVETLDSIIVNSVIGWGNLTQPKNCISLTGSTSINVAADVTLVDSPLLIDPTNNNLNLLPNSPAITSGGETVTADHWFAPSGVGLGDGSSEANAQTFSQANLTAIEATLAGSGGLIKFVTGTYTLAAHLKFCGTGSINGIAYKAEDGCVIDGIDTYKIEFGGSNLIENIEFDNFKFLNGEFTDTFNRIRVVGTSGSSITFKRCHFDKTVTGNGYVFSANIGGTTVTCRNCIFSGILNSGGYSLVGGAVVTSIDGSYYFRSGSSTGAALVYLSTLSSTTLVESEVAITTPKLSGTISGTVYKDPTIVGVIDGSEILEKPLFIDPVNGNFGLLPNSPCITA